MLKTIKVMLVIAVAGGMVQTSYFIAELFAPESSGYSSYEFETLRKMLVYWFSGAISAVGALLLWRKERIMSVAVGSGGIYLMVLGANGGLWSEHMLWFRLILAALNVAFFLAILRRISTENEKA